MTCSKKKTCIPDPPGTVEPIEMVETDAASQVSSTSFQANGEVLDMGLNDSGEVFFQYRKQGETAWSETAPQSITTVGTFSAEILGLNSGSTYEFRAVFDGDHMPKAFGDTNTADLADASVSVETSWQFEDEGYFLFSDNSDQGSAQHDRSHRGPYEDPETGPDMGGGSFIGSPWSFTQADELGIRLDFEDDNSCHLDAPDNSISKVSGGSGDNLMPSSGEFAPERDHHGVFNNNNLSDQIDEEKDPQEGEAILIVKANKNTRIKFAFTGLGERAHPTDASDWSQSAPGIFEEMRLYGEDITADPSKPPGSKDSPTAEEDWFGWARAPGGSGDTGHPADCRAGMDPVVNHQDSVGDGSFPNTYDLTAGNTYRFRVYCTTRDCWYHIGAHYEFNVTFEDL